MYVFQICIKYHLPEIGWLLGIFLAYGFQVMGKVTPHLWIAENEKLTVIGSQDGKLLYMDWWIDYIFLEQ